MQPVINRPLVRQKARQGKIAMAVGIVALAFGFISSLSMSAPGQEPDWALVTASYAALMVALAALSFGRYHIGRWSRRPRADEVLAEALKGFDTRYYLLSYLPGLPVEHLLVTPHCLLALITRNLAGDIRNEGSRWSRKFSVGQIFGGYSDGNLGNPGLDARRGTAAIRDRLNAQLGASATDVPVSAAIVFTDQRANLRINDPAVPVIAPDELRNHVRTLYPENKLPRETMEKILQIFAPNRAQFDAQASKEPKSRRRRSHKPASPVDQSKLGRNRAERRMR